MINKLFINFCIIVFLCASLYSQDVINSDHIHEHAQIMMHNHQSHHVFHDITQLKGLPRLSYSWANPTISPSPQPPLTGNQMGIVTTPSVQPLGFELDGKVKVFKLYAQPIEQYIIDGKEADYEQLISEKNKVSPSIMHHHHIEQKLRAWGFNGTTPGPTIEVNEGDRIRLVIKNELPEPISIHSHGIQLPNNQDGEGGFAEPVIMPGETRNYEYTLYQSGTAFYHGEFNLMKATSYGLVGAIVIHPKKYKKKN